MRTRGAFQSGGRTHPPSWSTRATGWFQSCWQGSGRQVDAIMAEPVTPPGANPPSSPGVDQYPTIDPAAMTVIEGVEHKLDSMLQRDVHVYLWVDINGLKIIDKKSKHVQWSARLNTIVQVRARRAGSRPARVGVGFARPCMDTRLDRNHWRVAQPQLTASLTATGQRSLPATCRPGWFCQWADTRGEQRCSNGYRGSVAACASNAAPGL